MGLITFLQQPQTPEFFLFFVRAPDFLIAVGTLREFQQI